MHLTHSNSHSFAQAEEDIAKQIRALSKDEGFTPEELEQMAKRHEARAKTFRNMAKRKR